MQLFNNNIYVIFLWKPIHYQPIMYQLSNLCQIIQRCNNHLISLLQPIAIILLVLPSIMLSALLTIMLKNKNWPWLNTYMPKIMLVYIIGGYLYRHKNGETKN